MKKQILSISIIVTLVISISACAQSKKGTKVKSTTAKTTTTSASETTSKSKAKSDKITFISMERTSCFGQCPHYRIEIYESGLVKYSGKSFADPKGDFEKTIGKETVSAIFNDFSSFRVDTCQAEYTMLVSDFPGLSYVIKYDNGKSQQIRNAHFGPDFLKLMGKEIDKRIKANNTWKKTAEYNEEN